LETHWNKLNFWDAQSWDSQSTVSFGQLSGAVGSVGVAHTDPLLAVSGKMATEPVQDADDAINNRYVSRDKLSGSIWRVEFTGNPGAIKQPEIVIYLDGKRPSISTHGKLLTKVWTDGQQGESNDYFGDHCDGVTVRLNNHQDADTLTYGFWLGGLTAIETSKLKKCLGDSDFNTANNVDVQNWDHGNMYYPHIIKLVRTVTSHNDGGYYAAVWFDAQTNWDTTLGVAGAFHAGTFRLVNPISQMNTNIGVNGMGNDDYEVYTTQGTLALTSNYSQATFGLGTNNIYTVAPEFDVGFDDGAGAHEQFPYDGDISCEIGQHNAYKMKYIFHCLNKTDIFTVLNWEQPRQNPMHINLYTATRLFTSTADWSVEDRPLSNTNFFLQDHEGQVPVGRKPTDATQANQNQGGMGATPDSVPKRRLHGYENDAMAYMTHVVNTDISTNWAVQSTADTNGGEYPFYVYKFFPAKESTYNYVNECSNRGLCDGATGLCHCFPGYTSDDCSVQDSIAF